jgi:hypothetical protein
LPLGDTGAHDREPIVVTSRQRGDMSDRSRTPHAGHDLLLVAAHAAGDTLGADTERAAALVATCPDCAALSADLVAIAAATHDIPAAARPREFTLRPEDAARLRPRGWRRLAASFGANRLELVRPLAAGLTTLGLAGILLAGLPVVQGQAGNYAVLSKVGAAIGPDSGGAASSSGPSLAAAPAASAAAASGYPDGGTLTPVASPSGRDQSGEAASPAAAGPVFGTAASPAASGTESIRSAVGQPTPSSPQLAPAVQDSGAAASGVNVPLLSVSIVLLVVGLGLLILRRATKNAGGA